MGFWKDKILNKVLKNEKGNDLKNGDLPSNFSNSQEFPQQPNLNNPFPTTQSHYPQQPNNYYPEQTHFNSGAMPSYQNPNSDPFYAQQPYNQYQEGHYNSPSQFVNPHYFDSKNQQFTLPKELASEVRNEKYRLILTMILSFIIILSTLIPLILWIVKNSKDNLIVDDSGLLPHPVIISPFLIIAVGFFFTAVFDFIKIKREVDTYLRRFHFGSTIIPNFIINSYKKMHMRTIIINWIAFPTYFFGVIIIGILYSLSKLDNPKIFGFILLTVKVKDLSTEIIIFTIVLFAIFFLQILNIIFIRKRKANIIGFYGYEIVNPNELELLKKKINRRCFIIFLVFIITLTFIISVPILLLRRLRKKQ